MVAKVGRLETQQSPGQLPMAPCKRWWRPKRLRAVPPTHDARDPLPENEGLGLEISIILSKVRARLALPSQVMTFGNTQHIYASVGGH